MSNTYKYVNISHNRWKIFFYLAVIVFVNVFIYSGSFENGFLPYLDDGKLIINNPLVKDISLEGIKNIFTEKVYGLYHPLTTLSWAIEYHYKGNDPWIYHLSNLLLHILNSIIVYLIIKKLTKKHESGFFVALFFAIHPLHIESVVWLSERKDVLYSFFFLYSILVYQNYLANTAKNKWLALSLLLFLFSVLSKSAAVVLPVVLLLFDYYYKRKITIKLIVEKIPFFVVSILFGIINILTQKSDEFLTDISQTYNFPERILLITYSISFYIVKLFIPINLSVKYFYPVKINGLLPYNYYFSILFIALLIFIFIKLKQYRREMIFSLGFFFITIGLVLKIIPTGNDIVSDRYTYIPYIGLMFLVFYIVDSILKGKQMLKIITIIVIILVGILLSNFSKQRVKIWKNEETIWTDVINKNPKSPVAYNERGQAYLNMNLLDKALFDFNKAIELNPNFALAYFKRGILQNKNNKYKEAIKDYDESIRIDNSNPEAYVNRGKCYALLKMDAKALFDFDKAILLDENQTTAYNNKGIVLASQNKYKVAIQNFTKSISLNPYQIDAYVNRGFANYKTGNFEKAKLDLNKVFDNNSGNEQFMYILAQCEYRTTNHEKSLKLLSRLIDKSALNLKAIYLRAIIYAKNDNYNKAIADFTSIINLNPNFSDAYLNRGNSYFFLNDIENACKDWNKAKNLGNKNAGEMLGKYCNK